MLILNYIVRRLAQMALVVLGVTLFAFLTIQLVPGDPIRIMLHGRATDEVVAAAHQRLGLDQPLPVQFARFVWNALHGDLGISIIQKASVTEIVGERLEASVFLLTYSALIAVALALPLALIAASRKDRPIDHAIRIGGMIGFAMPPFWMGLLLMLFFGLTLGLLPIAGYGKGFLGHLVHLTLPSLTIALFLAPILIQSLRAAMLDVMTADYIEVARAKGLSERRILVKHVLRNALIPTITVLAVNIGWLLSSAVIVEYVFSIPGLGTLLVRAVGFRDYPVIQGLAVVFAMLVVTVNLLADLIYILV
ncbi:MAG: ABC transporter permease, partial [Kiloniellales bacterium]